LKRLMNLIRDIVEIFLILLHEMEILFDLNSKEEVVASHELYEYLKGILLRRI